MNKKMNRQNGMKFDDDSVFLQLTNNLAYLLVHPSTDLEKAKEEFSRIYRFYTGMKESRQDYTLIVHGDFNHDLSELSELISSFSSEKNGVFCTFLQANYPTSLKIRDITNQYLKALKPVEAFIDNVIIFCSQRNKFESISLHTCGMEGLLEEKMCYPVDYPTDHWPTLLMCNFNMKFISVNALGRSLKTGEFLNTQEYLTDFTKLNLYQAAKADVDSSEEFAEFVNEWKTREKSKAKNAYNKLLKDFEVYDIQEFPQGYSHPNLDNVVEARNRALEEMESRLNENNRELAYKMLDYHRALINHPLTLESRIESLNKIAMNPKRPISEILSNYSDIGIYSITEANVPIFEQLYSYFSKSYNFYVDLNGNSRQIVDEEDIELLRDNSDLNLQRGIQTFGIIMKSKV